MPELRLNLISREWVIVGSHWAKKPEDFKSKGERKYLPEHLDSCPFCPGNESKTPDDLLTIPEDGPWKVRVTQNKFPILSLDGERIRTNNGVKRKVTGVGHHEVIIDSPRHDMTFALMELEDITSVLHAYKSRFNSAFQDYRIQQVIIFNNHGQGSGTSLEHPHSQLIASPVISLQSRFRIDEAMRFFDSTGECLVCSVLKDELDDGARIIFDSEHFVSFVPYAALSPFHMWVFPKMHTQSFGITPDEHMADLALTLKTTLHKIYDGLGDPSYNLILRSLSPYRSRSEYVHWYISIVPQVIHTTGFELGTGMHVNVTPPEEVAQFLRSIKV